MTARLLGMGASLSGTTGSLVTGVLVPDRYPLPLAITVAAISGSITFALAAFGFVERLHARQCEHLEWTMLIQRTSPDHLSEVAVALTGQQVTIATSRRTSSATPVEPESTGETTEEKPPPPALRPAG